MFKRVMFVLLVISAGCNPEAPNETSTQAVRTFEMSGITGEIPADDGWTLDRSTDSEVVYSKSDNETDASLAVRFVELSGFTNNEEFFAQAEEMQNDLVAGYEIVSGHFNALGYKNTACLHYDGIYRDTITIGSDRDYLNLDGYLCRLETSNTVVRMEFSARSPSRNPTEMEHLLGISRIFFDQIVFQGTTD